MSTQPSTFLLGPVEHFVGLHGQAPKPQQVINVAIMSGWTYVLTDTGDLTVQETFRCTKNIAPRGRGDSTCESSVLSISTHNSRQAFLSLTYPPAPTTGARGSPAGATYDTLLVSCDGTAISTGRLPQLQGAPPASACWLGHTEVAVGCTDGSCHIITLRRVALKERRGVPTLQVNAAARLAVEVGGELARESICAVEVLQGRGDAGDGCDSLVSGRSGSADGGDDAPRSMLLATPAVLAWHAGHGSWSKVLRSEEAAAGGKVVSQVEAGSFEVASQLSVAPAGTPLADDGIRAAWLAADTLTLLSFPLTAPPVPPPITLAALRGGQAVPAAPKADDFQSTRVETAAVIAAVQEASAKELRHGGHQGPSGDGEAEPLRCMSVVMGRWHVTVLVAGVDGDGRWISCIAVVSHITGKVVQVLPCPEGIGELLSLIQDPLATSPDAAAPSRTPLVATTGVAQAYVVGRAGIAAVLASPDAAADAVWLDFVAVKDYTAALRLLDEVEMDLQFAAADRLESGGPDRLPGRGSGGDLSGLRELDLDGGGLGLGLGDGTWERLQAVQVSKARVRLARAEAARDAGDYVQAARSLGHITASVAAAGDLPSFQQLALWFQSVPYDTLAVSEAKATALEVFLTTKLKQYDTHAPDAASTSLALWLLEILLARCASEAVTPRSGQPPPPPQPTPRDAEPSQEVATFIRRHQALLPWQAVEQVLRAGGRRSDLKAAARIYHVWPLVFSLSLPGDVSGALAVLPKLRRELLAPSLAQLTAADPLATCTALEHSPGLSCVTPLMVAHTMGSLAKPDVPVATRTALLRYLQNRAIFSGSRDRVLHDLYVVLLILHPEEHELHRYLDSAESRTDHDAQHAAQHDVPRRSLELPVSDLQPISDARSNPLTSECGTGSAGRGSPADTLAAEAAGPAAAAAAAPPATAAASHPFVFDAFRAVRLAKAHGKVASARRMLVELNAFEAAIDLAATYAEGLSVVEEAQDPHMQRRLWLSVLRRVMESEQQAGHRSIPANGNAPAAATTDHDATPAPPSKCPPAAAAATHAGEGPADGGGAAAAAAAPGEVEVVGSVDALDACISDTVQRELLAVEDVLGLLPEQQTLRSYKSLLVKHMETTSFKVQGAGEKARRAVQVSGALEAQLLHNRKSCGSTSWGAKCFACGAPLRSPPVCSVPTGGAIPKIQVFPSGACYHTSCAVEQILRSTAHLGRPVAGHGELLATLDQLARSTPHTDRDAVLEAQQRLHRWLKEGDPLHTERALDFLEQGLSVDEDSARSAGVGGVGGIGGKNRQPRLTLTLPQQFGSS